MKKAVLAAFLSLFVIYNGFSQEETEKDPLVFLFGPRLGVSFSIMSQKNFNSIIHPIFSGEHSYYPIYTEIGFSTIQQIDLGGTNNFMVFQETFFLGGLDQNFALPFAAFLMGYRSSFGFEAGVGPYFSLFYNTSNKNVQLLVSLDYMVGWAFSGKNFSIPINVHFIPYPSYAHPQFTVVCGINFEVSG